VENREHIQKLLAKYLERKCKTEEISQLLEYFNRPQDETALKAAIMQFFEDAAEKGQCDEAKVTLAIDDVHARLMANINKDRTKIKHIQWIKLSVAASILMLISLGIYSYFSTSTDQKQSIVKVQQQDVSPGGNKGTLTLADGSEVSLEKTKNESFVRQGNTTIKNKNGQLIYDSRISKNGNVSYNKLTIPRGGQYQLTLPDGTKVWLNAASSIAFPTAFTGKERRVIITGEVYFEVASLFDTDKEKIPFIVNVNDETEIKVLGTHFNINSYPEEGAIKTTLLEGSVEVTSLTNHQSLIIVPGQQVSIDKSGLLTVEDVNTEEVIAWKNGYFYFDNDSLQTIMDQLARWYDVKITYEGDIPDRIFTGKIHRDINLSEALAILKFTKVNFRIEDKSIIVIP
jgi:transmembrane sensor